MGFPLLSAMTFPLTFSDQLRCTIDLPTSKSLSARALIVRALSQLPCELKGLSDCDDTRAVQAALEHHPPLVDIGAAGTAMRFLTAFYALRSGEEHTLTGTARMQERPIGQLVEALRDLGADIEYLNLEGFPPLRIRGRALEGGALRIAATTSSQYISALLMIAPQLAKGLQLTLEGKIASRPYIEMTLGLMREWGVESHWEGNTISIAPQAYQRTESFTIEADWSAASYWYSLVALSPDPETRVVLPHLHFASWQGDSHCATLFRELGVHTMLSGEKLVLTKRPFTPRGVLEIDFSQVPDLAQTLVVACAMLGQAFHFTGLRSLKIKETNRVAALQNELRKFGIQVVEPAEGELLFMPTNTASVPTNTPISIATYDDHRMAMAFAPTAYRYSQVSIEQPEVVSKSYPHFWNDLAQLQPISQ